jgi:hypothetical protein
MRNRDGQELAQVEVVERRTILPKTLALGSGKRLFIRAKLEKLLLILLV